MFNLRKILPLILFVIPVLSLLVIVNLHAAEPFIQEFTEEPSTQERSAHQLSSIEGYEDLTPYYYAAARTGDDDVIEVFLNAGLPIDIRNRKGYTALMIATYNGRISIVNSLVARGANVCAEDNKGNTALMAAIVRAEFTIANLLMKSDCDANQKNRVGQTAVMYATLFGREELKAMLISRGADVHLKDHNGISATSLQATQ